MNSSQNKRVNYEHSYKPWTTLKTREEYEHSYKPRTALKISGRNMNTPTNHEQLSKQEGEIWTLLQTMNSSKIQEAETRSLLQTMNSSQNKREAYEHSYKPRPALKISGRNMNTPTNHEQLKKQETEIRTLLQTMNSFQNKRQKYEHSYKQ